MNWLLNDFIADLELVYVVTDFGDFSRVLVAHYSWDRYPFVPAFVTVGVCVASAESRGVDANKDLIVVRFRTVSLLKFDRLGSSLNDSFHCWYYALREGERFYTVLR
ncbi:hypothetical protein HAL_30650 [Haladaptatus sp. T7]|nr:hypothetical protein HAL_30650 [Haladaptatus sp. T7]